MARVRVGRGRVEEEIDDLQVMETFCMCMMTVTDLWQDETV